MSSAPVRELEQELRALRWLPPPAERRAIRLKAGASQARLARAVGVSRQAVKHWEDGTRSPRGAALRAYVEALHSIGAIE